MESMRKIEPVKPAAPYIGGKSRLAKTVISYIDRVPHKTYAEPFVGMGGVFLRRQIVPRAEVINDKKSDVANFFRILQRHYIPFIEMIRWQITTRAEFERLTAANPETLTDLERAARFLYLQKTAYGGNPSGNNFGVDRTSGGRFNVTKLVPMLDDLHTRLAGVTIERLDYTDFIAKYDSEQTLFYLDPPYYGTENYYGKNLFSKADFALMAVLLSRIKGTFILSINDKPEIRETFAKFHIKELVTEYTIRGNRKDRTAHELLISNRDLFT